jgi:hypothetical protein
MRELSRFISCGGGIVARWQRATARGSQGWKVKVDDPGLALRVVPVG